MPGVKKKPALKETSKPSNTKGKTRRKRSEVVNDAPPKSGKVGLFNISQSELEELTVVNHAADKLTSSERSAKKISEVKDSMCEEGTIEPKVPEMLKDSTTYCTFCNVYFQDKSGLQTHCMTEEHHMTLISDEGRDWRCRPPPRGLLSDEYSMCPSVSSSHQCRFGDQCIEAHTTEELIEWKERFQYRSMKLEKAKEKELHGTSCVDKLIERLNAVQDVNLVLSEKVNDVSTTIDHKHILRFHQKPSEHVWTISINSPYLHSIVLLHDYHRNHFSITYVQEHVDGEIAKTLLLMQNRQEWKNPNIFGRPKLKGKVKYKIKIHFKAEVYGTFRQVVVFDFGEEPFLVQKFIVEVFPAEKAKEEEPVKKSVLIQSVRWCEENTIIVPFRSKDHHVDCNELRLQEQYPPPTNENVNLCPSSMEKFPSRENYKTRMHDLLNYEEMAMFDLISHFNVQSRLQLSKSYLLSPFSYSTAKYAQGEELYARLELTNDISEDNHHGRIILYNCNSILISANLSDRSTKNCANFVPDERIAYEVLIEAKTKKEIYILLSEQVVEALRLQVNEEVLMDIQFQLNRMPLCEMHSAIDNFSCMDMLFPRVDLDISIPWSPSRQWGDSNLCKLNPKQKEALLAITAPLAFNVPPILLIGPFGTGKTYTIGQAVKQLIQQPDTRILICTHSNSAADLYILDYLDQFVEEFPNARPLRVYYHKRWVPTVNQIVQKYCLKETIEGEQKFRIPTLDELMSHRIIIATINTSTLLYNIGLRKGYFTHILIDEAAQIMETSTLIPLALADNNCRVVLTGDYMQLSQEVFSPVCKDCNLHLSLLERLFDLYPQEYFCRIMLVENYRSHPDIIKFTSKLFYEGRLKSSGKVSPHPRHQPLSFFTARGEDVMDLNSTAFYNMAEVHEVCERVVEIWRSWPVKIWGPIDDTSIGVVTPYLDQVLRIRAELRKKKMFKVSVERVLNVQGKEFRVVILSTVRTRHTCSYDNAYSDLDFGFLSNEKLLTTAITRSQSLVAVVGDPIALCSLGKCRKLWEEFLLECSASGSLHGITWTALRSQLDGIEYKKIYGLNPLAQEFVPRYVIVPTCLPNNYGVMPPSNQLIPPGIFPSIPPAATFPIGYGVPPQVFFQNNQQVGSPLNINQDLSIKNQVTNVNLAFPRQIINQPPPLQPSIGPIAPIVNSSPIVVGSPGNPVPLQVQPFNRVIPQRQIIYNHPVNSQVIPFSNVPVVNHPVYQNPMNSLQRSPLNAYIGNNVSNQYNINQWNNMPRNISASQLMGNSIVQNSMDGYQLPRQMSNITRSSINNFPLMNTNMIRTNSADQLLNIAVTNDQKIPQSTSINDQNKNFQFLNNVHFPTNQMIIDEDIGSKTPIQAIGQESIITSSKSPVLLVNQNNQIEDHVNNSLSDIFKDPLPCKQSESMSIHGSQPGIPVTYSKQTITNTKILSLETQASNSHYGLNDILKAPTTFVTTACQTQSQLFMPQATAHQIICKATDVRSLELAQFRASGASNAIKGYSPSQIQASNSFSSFNFPPEKASNYSNPESELAVLQRNMNTLNLGSQSMLMNNHCESFLNRPIQTEASLQHQSRDILSNSNNHGLPTMEAYYPFKNSMTNNVDVHSLVQDENHGVFKDFNFTQKNNRHQILQKSTMSLRSEEFLNSHDIPRSKIQSNLDNSADESNIFGQNQSIVQSLKLNVCQPKNIEQNKFIESVSWDQLPDETKQNDIAQQTTLPNTLNPSLNQIFANPIEPKSYQNPCMLNNWKSPTPAPSKSVNLPLYMRKGSRGGISDSNILTNSRDLAEDEQKSKVNLCSIFKKEESFPSYVAKRNSSDSTYAGVLRSSLFSNYNGE